MAIKVICPYCDTPAQLVSGDKIYPHRRDLHHRKFWRCRRCDAYVGTHPSSKKHKPLGRLANRELRQAKVAAHEAFDWLWRSGKLPRSEAYKWLASKLGIPVNKCHIGYFDEAQCTKVVSVMYDIRRDFLEKINDNNK